LSHQLRQDLDSRKMLTRDVDITSSVVKEFLLSKHVKYLHKYADKTNESYEQVMVEYLRVSGIYWTTTAVHFIDNDFDEDIDPKTNLIYF
jgi:prenyltransferase beta subunit